MPAPAASYSLRLVRYQVRRTMCSGPALGLAEQLDDPVQGGADLCGHIGLIVALLVAAGLAGQHDPSAGTIDRYAVGKAAWLRPFGRLQGLHEQFLPGFYDRHSGMVRRTRPGMAASYPPLLSTDRIHSASLRRHICALQSATRSPIPASPPQTPRRFSRHAWPPPMDRTPSKPMAALWMVGLACPDADRGGRRARGDARTQRV